MLTERRGRYDLRVSGCAKAWIGGRLIHAVEVNVGLTGLQMRMSACLVNRQNRCETGIRTFKQGAHSSRERVRKQAVNVLR